ncbi:MAG: hypothetical protein K2W96_12120 [Gemmataceae bacterium]|nr:hypothetical protein [Gemmataceae bacterium]
MLSLLVLAAAPPVERAMPLLAPTFQANGWGVAHTREIVPGTERHRAQSFTHRLYAGKLGSGKARLVFSGRDTHGGPRILDVRPDGTVLLDIYPSRLR